jgi:hypothetical protein
MKWLVALGRIRPGMNLTQMLRILDLCGNPFISSLFL